MAAEGAAAPAAPRHRAGDLVMVAPEEGGDEPPCPARVTAVAAGGAEYDVTYCGWSRLWDAEGIGAARIEPPSADCAKLMAEIDALEGLFQIPRTRAVTHVGGASQLAVHDTHVSFVVVASPSGGEAGGEHGGEAGGRAGVAVTLDGTRVESTVAVAAG